VAVLNRWVFTIQIISNIKNMRHQFEHFHMSEDYELNSLSQKITGRYVIQQVIQMARAEFENPERLSVLDIACGPGNLTNELLHALEEGFPNTKIDLAGLDYSEKNVNILVEASRGAVKGIVGSFYEFPSAIGNENIIFSNHGLHWQPPYVMSNVKYTYLDSKERVKYETWALKNFKAALVNIYNAMNGGAIAVLQFGREGQIQKLWDLVNKIFDEPPFREYRNKVNFPVYHPSVANMYSSLEEAGFAKEHIDINVLAEDLSEDSPSSITNFFRGFTGPGISQFFNQEEVELFYNSIEEQLGRIDINEFRKGQLLTTIIKLKKT
jgi:SAM-dependent methyltransferase